MGIEAEKINSKEEEEESWWLLWTPYSVKGGDAEVEEKGGEASGVVKRFGAKLSV